MLNLSSHPAGRRRRGPAWRGPGIAAGALTAGAMVACCPQAAIAAPAAPAPARLAAPAPAPGAGAGAVIPGLREESAVGPLATTNGSVIGPDYTQGTLASEAVGRPLRSMRASLKKCWTWLP